MKIHLLSGFLGSGKTTAAQQAAKYLSGQNISTGVITNDQGIKLVDSDFFKNLQVPGRQVINGCFCCNYDALDASIESLVATNGTEVIFAESVGSCTDIVATVLKPLLRFKPGALVTLSVFADWRLLQMMSEGAAIFDDEVKYIFLKQLEEASVVIVNKTDLANKEQLEKISLLMQDRYGDKTILYQNSLDEKSVAQWLAVLDKQGASIGLRSLQIDYDTYAAGEAALAWLDGELEIFSANDSALQQANGLLNLVYTKIKALGYPIGHLKFLVNGTKKISFTSGTEPLVFLENVAGPTASLLVNIRVQTTPAAIRELVRQAIEETENRTGCRVVVNSIAAFQPGYPRPAHRL